MAKKQSVGVISEYPIVWKKKDFSIKIFCSIPNIATGILLKAGNSHFIVDPGDGILRDLNKELTPEALTGISDVFITHGHHDHVGGLWSLLTYLRVMHKTSPLAIFYPSGCVEIESLYSAFRKVYSNSIPYRIELRKIESGDTFRSKGVNIKPFPVVHKEHISDGKTTRQVPALGYKFSYNGTKICYGGDTAYCDTLVRHAKGADVAILEAGHEGDEPDEMHMTMQEATAIGKSAKAYFLVHVPE